MTTTLHLGKDAPWTEPEFLAIGETRERIELFDGSLHVTPGPSPRHQHALGELKARLRSVARQAGLNTLEGVNVRLAPGRIPIPDLVIAEMIDFDDPVIDASAVLLVCEVLSPTNSTTDKVLKMRYYAEAGIPWYLLVDPKTATLRLHSLDGAEYVEHSAAAPGELLELTEPVAVTIDPADLLPPR